MLALHTAVGGFLSLGTGTDIGAPGVQAVVASEAKQGKLSAAALMRCTK